MTAEELRYIVRIALEEGLDIRSPIKEVFQKLRELGHLS